MLYFISNSKLITQDIIDEISFNEDDKIFLFNRKHDNTFNFLLNSFKKKYKFNPNIIMCQRETLLSRESDYYYRGSTSPFISNEFIKTFYIISGGVLKKQEYDFNYNDRSIKKQTNRDFIKYKKHLLRFDKKRDIIFVDYRTMLPPYGMGYNIFDIKYYEPYTGFIMLLYIDNKFPNEDKTLVGFSCYSQRTKKRAFDIPTHRSKLEWELLLSYCKSRNVNLLYSKEIDGKLTNLDCLSDFKPMFTIDGTIDIEDRQLSNPDNIHKLDDYYDRVNDLFGKR